ncbi:MAG: UvrD-helicase domain-containing protein, partial [Pseudomonadota bacterium]
MAAPVFDPSSVALTGRTLIEASAGTGKTFTVTELYLRLVLEQKRKVSEILVLTYTNAATAELRERIRRRLFEARRVAQSDSDDWLTLNLAIESFDEAAIYTIHGFCQRALGDEAFAAGEPFSFELLPYRADAVLTVVKDVWREWGQCFGPLYADFLRQENVSPQSLAAWIDRHVGKPFLRVDGGDNAPSDTTLRTLEDDFSFAYRTASEVWQGSGDSLAGELLNGSLAKNRYSEGIVRRVVDGLSRAFRAPDPHFWGFADLPRVTSSALESATKRGEGTPSHPFIACADALAVAGDALRSGYQRRFAESRRELLLRTEDGLSALSRDQGVKFYDDLMNHLVRALDTASGETLAKRLRIRYPAALIDEFQDTDPAQLHLLRRIYAEDSATVIYVGDPKQAIYGFRGADVFAYLRARADADRVLSLGTNFRSTPHLVEGVNALFTRHGRPFLTDGISYAPVKPRADVRDALRIDGRRSAPVQLMTAAPGEAKGSASRAAALGCVGEIKHLIELGNDGRAVLGERALRGGDIAVVVRTHAQAQLIYRALRHEAISAVYRSNEDVFQTAEAFELCALLAAVMHPSDEALTRRALASPLLGFNAAQLHQLG